MKSYYTTSDLMSDTVEQEKGGESIINFQTS